MHGQAPQAGFSLTFLKTGDEQGFASRLLAGTLLYLGLGGCLWSMLGLAGTGASPLLLLIAGLPYCATSCGLPRKWRGVYFVAAIALAVYAIAASRFIIEGWGVTGNQIVGTLEHYLGRIVPWHQEITTGDLAIHANLFLMLPAAILAIICGRAIVSGGVWRYLLSLVAVVLWATALAFGSGPSVICSIALITSAAIMFGQPPTIRSQAPNEGKATPWQLILSISLGPVK